jgi:YHS domain-containing protein
MGKIFEAVFKHLKDKQADLPADPSQVDWQLLCQSINESNKLEKKDNGAFASEAAARGLGDGQLISSECRLTQQEEPQGQDIIYSNGKLSKIKNPLNPPAADFGQDLPTANKVLGKKQTRPSAGLPRVPQTYFRREFFTQKMRVFLPKFIDLGLVRIIFQTKFLFRPLHYIKLKTAEKIQYGGKIYYVIYLQTEIAFSVLVDRTGNFIMFTSKSSPLTPLSSDEAPGINVVDAQEMLGIKTKFFNNIYLLFDNPSFGKLFYDIFQLKIINIVNCRNGDFIHVQDQIFYQFFLNASITFSLIIDCQGNYIEMSSEQDELIPGTCLMESLSLQDPICKIDLKKKASSNGRQNR